MIQRIAIVTPWFGDDATGGAESLAFELSLRLAQLHDVTVLTTCSRSFLSEWDDNYYPAGATTHDGVKAIRFPVAPRSRTQFDSLNRTLLEMPRERWLDLRKHEEDTSAFIDESINSPALEAHLARVALENYDAVLFLPYLYGVIVRGIEAYPGRAHVVPCLHDEAYARLPRIENMFHRAATVLANSSGEAELLLRLYGPGLLAKMHVIGSGVDIVAATQPAPQVPANIAQPFVLYVGRRDITKGVDALVAAFNCYRRRAAPARLSLVLAGPGTRSYDDPLNGVHDLGYVSGVVKTALIEHSVGLLQPSENESYSRVLMEAWLRRKPVVVAAACLATATAVREAGGGFIAGTQDEWVEVLTALGDCEPTDLAAYGIAGESYARDRADWSRVLARLNAAIGLQATNGVAHRNTRIDQFVQTLEYGDAISDYALTIQRRLQAHGYDSTVYAEGIGPLVADRAVYFEPACLESSDAILYHHSIASDATAHIVASRATKALVYHNITPAAFFRPYSQAFANLLEAGRAQTANLMSKFDLYAADSDFNAAELRAMGAAHVRTVPVVVDFRRFDLPPDRGVFRKREDLYNVLFVGRVSPSKSIRRLIDTFEAFLCFNPRSHLTIVGRYDVLDPYYRVLVDIVIERRLENSITFVGIIHESTLLAYYQLADLYLSLSEHEGFCVPVVEAMFFDIPVVAQGTTAVPETMGAGGLLVTAEADPIEVAAAMHAVAIDENLRGQILAAQRIRREYFSPHVAERRIDDFVRTLVPL